ncbi:hypothetical protein ZEAMMB73_Zm00001d006848 [Zea mays]|uniref:Uncharacterized protein n=1 Tax=Zea mays TaxID=4577 RepID=A0A1D6F1A4_MAIZE|nr:hypothetical protein ZEAMMB73_Zm00001d006848 [Zea mays]
MNPLKPSMGAEKQMYGQPSGVRPFGVSLLIAGYDDNGPQLYQGSSQVVLIKLIPQDHTSPGRHQPWEKNVSNAKTFLGKRYEGQISSNNIEIGIIRADREFKVLSPSEIKDFLEEVEFAVVHGFRGFAPLSVGSENQAEENPVPKEKRPKRLEWTKEDEEKLVNAWFMHSNDPISGNNKSGSSFWGQIAATYNSTSDPIRHRTAKQLKDHWVTYNR